MSITAILIYFIASTFEKQKILGKHDDIQEEYQSNSWVPFLAILI